MADGRGDSAGVGRGKLHPRGLRDRRGNADALLEVAQGSRVAGKRWRSNAVVRRRNA